MLELQARTSVPSCSFFFFLCLSVVRTFVFAAPPHYCLPCHSKGGILRHKLFSALITVFLARGIRLVDSRYSVNANCLFNLGKLAVRTSHVGPETQGLTQHDLVIKKKVLGYFLDLFFLLT